MDSSPRALQWLAALGVALALVVVVLGAYTRLVDAGLGCPDWPGCYGFLGVPESADEVAVARTRFPDTPVEPEKAWPEMVHRYFASALGLLALVILALAWRYGARLTIPVALAVLVIVQGAFGAWTVTLKLWPQVVTAHLLGGFGTLALLWLYVLRLGMAGTLSVSPTFARPAAVGIALVVLQVTLGGWTSSNYAALACPDFPTCHGSLVPEMDFGKGFNVLQEVGPNYLGGALSSEARVAIQMTHRLGAVVVLILVGWLAHRLRGPLGGVVGGVLLVQFGLGIANVLLELPLVIATLHNAGGAILLLALVTVYAAAGGYVGATPDTPGLPGP